MKAIRTYMLIKCIIIILLLCVGSVYAEVPVKISVKFILDAFGRRPALGNLNHDADIKGEVDYGNEILANMKSELRLDLLEIIELAGVSHYYNTPALGNNGNNRDDLRSDAMSNPVLYQWRNDAINIYINGNNGAAISDFPPDNNIILMNQGCRSPDCILHEVGHSLNLMHTHETCCGGDQCADTITDNANWNRDDIALNNFGDTYNNLTQAQKDQVDSVWFNVMSYHPFVDRLTLCQMDRMSTQGYDDWDWLYTKEPIYVDKYYTGSSESGGFDSPYTTLQDALDAGDLNGKVLVLQQGSYLIDQEVINDNVEIVTRFGQSSVSPNGVQLYELPIDLENSENSKVSAAIKAVQEEDKGARKAIREAKKAAKKTEKEEEKAAIKAKGEAKRMKHFKNALDFLKEAERHAIGDEKIAIQLEMAQRYRNAGDFKKAVKYYNRVAEATDQQLLKEKAMYLANECMKKLLNVKEH